MPKINQFEDLETWKIARKLTNEIYSITRKDTFAKDYGLRDQIRRAAISVMSNIAEGFGRSGDREFSYFLKIAKGSVCEIESQLYIALDQKYITKDEFSHLITIAHKVEQLISGLKRHLKETLPTK